MNEQPSMKLMFKGYQGVFTDKLFCKLRRRRKWAKCCNFALLASFLPTYNLCPSWEQVRINFCSNWAEVGFGTSAQFGWRCISFYYQLGNNFAHILWALQIGKQCKPVQVYKFASSGNRIRFPLFTITLREIFANLACWVNTPYPLWTTPTVSAAHSFWILLLSDFYAICIEVQFPINEKWKSLRHNLCRSWKSGFYACGQVGHKTAQALSEN